MNKKGARKLGLNKETIKHLQNHELKNAAGGLAFWSENCTWFATKCQCTTLNITCAVTGCGAQSDETNCIKYY